MTPPEYAALITAAGVGGGAIWKIVDRFMSRGIDTASAEKLRAETKRTAQETAASEVTVLKEIIAEVRASAAEVRSSDLAKAQRIDRLEERLDLLEERERHMLTRAAVHEAWDQMAFAALVAQNPAHPPPPPLKLDSGTDEH